MSPGSTIICLLFLPYHTAFTISVITAYTLYLIFAPPVFLNIAFFALLLAGILGVAVIITAAYQMGNAIMVAWKLRRSTKCRVHFITALMIMLAFGLAPRVLVYFVGWNFKIMLSAILGGLSLPSYIHLVWFPSSPDCEIFYANNIKPKLVYTIYSIHMVLLIATARFALAISDDVWDTVAMIVTQVVFAPLCAITSVDMVLVLMGATQFRVVQGNGRTQVTPLKIETLDAPGDFELSNLECRICRMEYSEQRFPLIIRECGHTVCHKCAEKMMARYENTYMMCPFCQFYTVVRTPPTPLAKNYMLWDLIEEMKKRP